MAILKTWNSFQRYVPASTPQTTALLPRTTHTVHNTIGTTLSPAIPQMIVDIPKSVSSAAPITLDDNALPR